MNLRRDCFDGYRKLSMIIYDSVRESEQEYDLILGRAGTNMNPRK